MSDVLNIFKNNIPIENRTVFHSDNLIVLRLIKDNSIDLVYLDPPFNTGTDYEVDGKGFNDKWENPLKEGLWNKLKESEEQIFDFLHMVEKIHSIKMSFYLDFMSRRLIEIQRILKPSGKIVLHCDDNASHYLKICLDIIFGPENFRNDVSLLYKNGSKNAKNHFPRNKDNLLIYCKDFKRNRFFNTKTQPSEKTLRNIKKGWKITWNSRSNKWHETYYRPYETFSEKEIKELDNFRQKKLKERPAEIYIRHALNGNEIKYLDWWDDMVILPQSQRSIENLKNESVGWPTQKSIKILKRVLETCTEENDIVFDPFCGSGTTCEAAEIMKRKWIASDISEDAVNITCERIEKFMGMFIKPIYKETL